MKFSLLCVTDKTFCDLLVQSHFPPLLLLVLLYVPARLNYLEFWENFILLYASSLCVLFLLMSSLLQLIAYSSSVKGLHPLGSYCTLCTSLPKVIISSSHSHKSICVIHQPELLEGRYVIFSVLLSVEPSSVLNISQIECMFE